MTYPISNFGFIILNPDKSVSQLKTTLESIKKVHPENTCISVMPGPNNADLEKMCKTYKGKGTYSSLLNTGLHSSKSIWNVILFAGTWLKPNLENVIKFYLKEDTDILFPVLRSKTQRFNKNTPLDLSKTTFCQGSLNGVIMHKTAFKNIGLFLDSPNIGQPETIPVNDFELIKMEWELRAIAKGYNFKALFGTSIC